MFGEKLIAMLGLDATEFKSKATGSIDVIKVLRSTLGQISLGIGAGAVLGWFNGIIDKGGQLQDLSDQLGITTDSLQSLDFAASQAGVSAEQMATVYNKLTVAGAEAAEKGSASAKALAALAISAQDFANASPDLKLEMVAKAYASAEDKQSAFAAVADLVGSKVAPRLTGVLQDLATKGLDGVIASAKEAGQVIEQDTIKKFDDLGDKVSALKGRFENFGASILSGAFKFSEKLGTEAAKMVNLVQGIPTDYLAINEVADKVAVAVEKGNVALKGTAATAADLKKLEEARDRLREKSLSDAEKENFWLEKIVKAANEKSKYARDSKEAIELELEIMGFQSKISEQIAAAKKKAAEEAKKAADEEEKIAIRQLEASRQDMTNAERKRSYLIEETVLKGELAALDKGTSEYAETQNRLLEVQARIRDTNKAIAADQLEIAKLLLIPEDKRTDAQNEQLKLLTGQTTKAKEQLEIQRLTASLLAGSITPEERKRLEALTGQTKQCDDQKTLMTKQQELARLRLIDEKNLTDEVRNRIRELERELTMVGQIKRVGKEYDAQSTESLEYVRDQLKKQLPALEAEKRLNGYSAMLVAVQTELAQVMDELNKRLNFKNAIRGQGEDFTKRLYSPQEYERLFQHVVQGATDQKRIADTLESIETRLKPVLPKS